MKASTTLHDQVFEKLMSSPMRFFDVTPSGQILNRFSKDIDEGGSLKAVGTVNINVSKLSLVHYNTKKANTHIVGNTYLLMMA